MNLEGRCSTIELQTYSHIIPHITSSHTTTKVTVYYLFKLPHITGVSGLLILPCPVVLKFSHGASVLQYVAKIFRKILRWIELPQIFFGIFNSVPRT